jgi:hypothetical protein
MAGNEDGPEELAAVKIVAEMLGGGEYKSTDGVGAEDGMHDFDITLADGRRIALEVTSAIDPDVVRLRVAAFGKEGKERRWPAPDLAHNWAITIPEGLADPAGVVRGMLPLLAVFEHQGETRIDIEYDPAWELFPPDTPEDFIDAKRQMFDLRVRAATDLSPPTGGDAEVFFLISSGVGADIDKVNALVVERAQPKVAKLAKADADEKHLVVWLDITQPAAELATATGPPPSTPPALPPDIDVVWLVTPPLNEPGLIWRAQPPNGWEVIK